MAELLLFTCQYTQEFNWIIKRVYPIILIRKDKKGSEYIALSATVKMLSLVEGKKKKQTLFLLANKQSEYLFRQYHSRLEGDHFFFFFLTKLTNIKNLVINSLQSTIRNQQDNLYLYR